MDDDHEVALERRERRFDDRHVECLLKIHDVSRWYGFEGIGFWFGEDVAAMGVLFRASSPTAIPRLIVAIVVKAVDCLSFGPFAHVGKKILERAPSVAHDDAAPAIPSVFFICGVVTPLHHVPPAIVCPLIESHNVMYRT